MTTLRFYKYHALGNDYLVLDPVDCPKVPSPIEIKKICHRHYGLGSDGILYGPSPAAGGAFGLRIFNPDGSEAEKSGNGLRIFARYLFDQKRVNDLPFKVHTAGGMVECLVAEDGKKIRVEMGKVSFLSKQIPVTGPAREVINEKIEIQGRTFYFCAATVGNPHCVIPVMQATPELATQYGPHIETHGFFPNRTNVQFLEVIDRNNIRIEIWERGAGYTYASGSSSSAAAAVARKLDLVGNDVTVHMPGGTIHIQIADDYAITMTGPTTPVGVYQMNAEVISQKVAL
ncbi:MAG: diaminopimelate epimerase [Puniceicoccales bacterium]|jgi:diaminopimelate epimerase|nr:diaminopimelate epimerase [Puniceicoccales bacterium]